MNADKIREFVGSGKTVVVMLTNATVVSVKNDVRYVGSRYNGRMVGFKKFVVKDENLGTVWFSSSSNKLWDMVVGDKITCKATLTGMGKPTPRYPNPMMFAKVNTRQNGLVIDSVAKTTDSFGEGGANDTPSEPKNETGVFFS